MRYTDSLLHKSLQAGVDTSYHEGGLQHTFIHKFGWGGLFSVHVLISEDARYEILNDKPSGCLIIVLYDNVWSM